MRYDKRIIFIKSERTQYDPVAGKNVTISKESETYPCNVSDLGIDRTLAIYGESKRDAKVARLQRTLNYEPVAAKLNGKRYDIENHRLNNRVFYLVGDE